MLFQLYIILIRPERNVRQSMMPVRYSAINKTTNSGQSMMAAVMVTAATCNQKEKLQKHVPPITISVEDSATQVSSKHKSSVFRMFQVMWGYVCPIALRFAEISTQTTLAGELVLRAYDDVTKNGHTGVHDDGVHHRNSLISNNFVNNNRIETSCSTSKALQHRDDDADPSNTFSANSTPRDSSNSVIQSSANVENVML